MTSWTNPHALRYFSYLHATPMEPFNITVTVFTTDYISTLSFLAITPFTIIVIIYYAMMNVRLGVYNMLSCKLLSPEL